MMTADGVDAFEAKVAGRIRELQEGPLWRLERRVAARREEWIDAAVDRVSRRDGLTPREAFEALFFTYMGLPPETLPVIAESEDEIVWRSENPCPTLEACLRLGKDTRDVCRAVYDRPTQRFLSRLDPQLRFVRDYRTLRPHAPHCLERIVRVRFDDMMRIAIDEAKASFAEGNKGYGALVVMGRDILAVGHDTAVTDRDPSRHAEFKVLREAVSAYGDTNLTGAVLVSTCEPCPMCAAMAVWCNVTSIVYGASIADTVAIGRTRIQVDSRTVVDNAPATMEVIGGVLKDACLDLYRY